ncbi:hypothetical protein [Oxalicibacterium faecigallinarum]|uniref:Uncharacterized protein n=1 Tax=Oxalicibacterium faecigallinarum TaxID=573741 RepID=A0A8J3ASY9_9BURK|nr:hypothetical protein [Oxalicibacterium faecigallinarum]GGI18309.1 hypothetical protein GCM10008066_13360 [Oxalicibacterium faecigallinarum]
MHADDYLTLVAEFDALWSKNGSDATRTRMDELVQLIRAFESRTGEAEVLAQLHQEKTSHQARFLLSSMMMVVMVIMRVDTSRKLNLLLLHAVMIEREKNNAQPCNHNAER